VESQDFINCSFTNLPNIYAVIMAGGSGTRFWPLSRAKVPKQVLSILGPKSLIQETVARLEGLIPSERILVVTNRQQKKVISAQLASLSDANYLLEPSARNTAPCIGLAALHILKNDPDGVMVVLPSDHLVKDPVEFRRVVKNAVETAVRQEALVTIGIPPTRPETGYGYIQFAQVNGSLPAGVHQVKTFAEKPNKPTAIRFLSTGDFYWNSGIFIWKASKILHEFEEHLPETYHQLLLIDRAIGTPSYAPALASRYNRIKPISIDYGVMEVTNSPIYMVEGRFGWSDVGSWDELYRQQIPGAAGNVIIGEGDLIDTENCFIYSPQKLTAVVGLNNLLVVNTANAILICPLDRAQEVKLIVEKLKASGKEKYI
jgi:mannose-1-phosphate guanylyltransferase